MARCTTVDTLIGSTVINGSGTGVGTTAVGGTMDLSCISRFLCFPGFPFHRVQHSFLMSRSFTNQVLLDLLRYWNGIPAYKNGVYSCRNSSMSKWRNCTFLHSVRRSPSLLRNMSYGNPQVGEFMVAFLLVFTVLRRAMNSLGKFGDFLSLQSIFRQACDATLSFTSFCEVARPRS